MNLPRIISNRQFKWMAIGTAAIALIFMLINLFAVGGDEFINMFNSGLNFPLALINAIAAVSIWRWMRSDNHNRFLWAGIMIGWSLWALAELIWAVYLVLGQESYPSLADFFWVIGYVPMIVGLVTRVQTMPCKPTRSQTMFIWGVSIATILITLIFIFIPIVQDFDSQRLIKSILNLLYPLLDLILVTIVWRLFFTYEEGDYGFGWRLLTLGFICNTTSDFLYIYTDWNGLYYPDGQANFVSRMVVDFTYGLSYLLWFMGIYALGILLREKRPIEPVSRIRIVRTYGHILVYTQSDDTVLDISSNFGRFFENVDVIGKPLANSLTISEQNALSILEKLRKEGRIADLPVQIRNSSGAAQEMRLSGVAITNSQKGYLGANLLLRLRVTDESFDDTLDQSSKAMVKYLLNQSGSTNKAEIAQFLSDYYLSFIRALLNMAYHEGGAATSQALLQKLQKTAEKYDWQIQFNEQTVLDHNDYPLETLRESLPVLLETAKDFVSNLTDPAHVEARMEEISSQFSETIHRDVMRYAKINSEMDFADHRKKQPVEQG
jgi:hypothetical protein